MADYTSFRQRLDAVLRTLDGKQVSDFLIAEKQWQPGQPSDPTYAMWMVATQSCPFYTESLKGHISNRLHSNYTLRAISFRKAIYTRLKHGRGIDFSFLSVM